MPTERSTNEVEALKKAFEGSPLVITAQYKGLKMVQINGLRNALRPTKSKLRVVKNTLAGIAADQAGRPAIREVMGGQVAIVTSQGDPASAAKALVNYLQTSRMELKLQGGVLDSQILTVARIEELAKLPGREQLLARVLGQMSAPTVGLVTVLSGPVRALAIALGRVVEQRGAEQSADAPAAAPASA
ncbi:MAG: 50S ribosomal protein L10 [Dehalococcoidia bacterium]|nr:50S ribosomal protein L10 [Dehalococcoidia bacterium]